MIEPASLGFQARHRDANDVVILIYSLGAASHAPGLGFQVHMGSRWGYRCLADGGKGGSCGQEL